MNGYGINADAGHQGANVFHIESKNALMVAIVMMVISVSFSIIAMAYARLAEREARIIEDDTKYIRAYLSARGIHIPANHEEAEER
jgi:hypothetical protein